MEAESAVEWMWKEKSTSPTRSFTFLYGSKHQHKEHFQFRVTVADREGAMVDREIGYEREGLLRGIKREI